MNHRQNPYERGYLLPPGCKDLIDALKLQSSPSIAPAAISEVPAVAKGELLLPPRMSVRDLSRLIGLKPFRLIGDLIEFGILARVDELLTYETLAKIVVKHGYQPIPAGQ